jgi:hypothetical protein
MFRLNFVKFFGKQSKGFLHRIGGQLPISQYGPSQPLQLVAHLGVKHLDASSLIDAFSCGRTPISRNGISRNVFSGNLLSARGLRTAIKPIAAGRSRLGCGGFGCLWLRFHP